MSAGFFTPLLPFFTLPSWVWWGLGSLLLNCGMPLVQERAKADGFALAFWNKVFTVGWMAPFLLTRGLPGDPWFYALTGVIALLWCGADVVYFRALPAVGAPVVARLLPVSIIATFFLWFLFDPGLLHRYLAQPWRAGAVVLVLAAALGFAARLRHCAVSWRAVRMIWFLLAAACVTPVLQKLALSHAPRAEAPFLYVFVQGVIMVAAWSLFIALRRPAAARALTTRRPVVTALIVSFFSAFSIVLKNFAYIRVDHPAYLSVLLLCDSVILLGFHRLMGRRDGSKAAAGFGMVACAAALILIRLKS